MVQKHDHLPDEADTTQDSSLPAHSGPSTVRELSPAAKAQLPEGTPSNDVDHQHETPTSGARAPGRLRRACTFMAVHAAKGAATSAGGLLVTALWVYLSHR